MRGREIGRVGIPYLWPGWKGKVWPIVIPFLVSLGEMFSRTPFEIALQETTSTHPTSVTRLRACRWHALHPGLELLSYEENGYSQNMESNDYFTLPSLEEKDINSWIKERLIKVHYERSQGISYFWEKTFWYILKLRL